ncbi:MAG: Bug family tripartite tricarboxylate transporter substrate binding protein [Beijerinckiaceae bacterium]
MRTKSLTIAALAAALAAPYSAAAQNFYEGKTIRMIVGSDAGGGFDTFARLFSRHLDRFIPGAPLFVVQNMPGAGSGNAAAYVANAAPKDGTVIAALNPGGLIAPLFAGRGAKFDASKLQYLASADTTARVCFTMKNGPIRTAKEAQANEVIIGAGAVGSSSFDYAYMHQRLNGMKFKIVAGYKGMADILLSLERGEVQGICGYDWSGLNAVRPQQVKDGAFNYLLQVAVESVPELDAMGVPNAASLTSNAEDKAALELLAGQQLFGRPYAVAPEVSADKVAILRKAFADVMKDKKFLEEVEKLKLSVSYAPGEQVQALIQKMYASPASVVERAKEAIRP